MESCQTTAALETVCRHLQNPPCKEVAELRRLVAELKRELRAQKIATHRAERAVMHFKLRYFSLASASSRAIAQLHQVVEQGRAGGFDLAIVIVFDCAHALSPAGLARLARGLAGALAAEDEAALRGLAAAAPEAGAFALAGLAAGVFAAPGSDLDASSDLDAGSDRLRRHQPHGGGIQRSIGTRSCLPAPRLRFGRPLPCGNRSWSGAA